MTIWDAIPYLSALVVVGSLAATRAGWKRSKTGPWWTRWAWRGSVALATTFAALSLVAMVATFWYIHRKPPPPTSDQLFEGITYDRIIRDQPRSLVIHVVRVDLRTEGLRFLSTPDDPESGRMLRARRTTDFLDEFGLQLAINANFFHPFASGVLWDYYPRSGDPVDVCGVAASRGKVYSTGYFAPGTLYLSAANKARFEEPDGPVETAIAGNGFLVRNGQSAGPWTDHALYPRAALGLDRDRHTLILLVVDGKQPHYSEGTTLDELAAVLVEQGCHDAIRLDEGGSATLATQGPDGSAILLNCPINSRIPGFERPVANHLGIFARRR